MEVFTLLHKSQYDFVSPVTLLGHITIIGPYPLMWGDLQATTNMYTYDINYQCNYPLHKSAHISKREWSLKSLYSA